MPVSRVSVLATVIVFAPAPVTVVPVITGASQRNAGSADGGPRSPSVAVHTEVSGTSVATTTPSGFAVICCVPPATGVPLYVHDHVTGYVRAGSITPWGPL